MQKKAKRKGQVHGRYVLPETLSRRLKVEAARHGLTVQETIRQTLDRHLPKL